MNIKWYWYSGIVAVVLYVVAVTIGGMLYPGYSHISQDISQLTSTNSPIRDIMKVFLVYNLLVSFFGIGLYRLSSKTAAKVGALFIIAIGILGIVIDWFPINTRGTDITSTGVIHIMIVTLVSIMTVLSGFLFWRGFRNTTHHTVANISLSAGIGFLIFGPIAAMNVMSPYAGLYERIPIGIFLTWILAVSINVLNRKKCNTYRT